MLYIGYSGFFLPTAFAITTTQIDIALREEVSLANWPCCGIVRSSSSNFHWYADETMTRKKEKNEEKKKNENENEMALFSFQLIFLAVADTKKEKQKSRESFVKNNHSSLFLDKMKEKTRKFLIRNVYCDNIFFCRIISPFVESKQI